MTYRKTKDQVWVAFGPAAELRLGTVTVRKKDGRAQLERVERVGKPFDVAGVAHAYGYLVPSGPTGTGPARTRGRGTGCCGACGGACPTRYDTCWDCKQVMDEDMGHYS